MEQIELPLNTKDVDAPAVNLGDTTNLPQNYDSFASSLWETLTFQRNVNLPFAPANDKALGLSIAMQCAAVKARDIAKAEMYLWRKSGRTYVRVEPGEHWFSRMLARRPNDYHSWAEFWRMVITHYALSQNSYILKRPTRAEGRVAVPTAACTRPDGHQRHWQRVLRHRSPWQLPGRRSADQEPDSSACS